MKHVELRGENRQTGNQPADVTNKEATADRWLSKKEEQVLSIVFLVFSCLSFNPLSRENNSTEQFGSGQHGQHRLIRLKGRVIQSRIVDYTKFTSSALSARELEIDRIVKRY